MTAQYVCRECGRTLASNLDAVPDPPVCMLCKEWPGWFNDPEVRARLTGLPPQVVEEIVQAVSHPQGPAGRLREAELARGFHLLPVGALIPVRIPPEDWNAASVISLNGKDVRLVLITATRPGNGALKRLVAAIIRAGFTPVIVAPIGEAMPAILKRWRWRESKVGAGFERHSEWRPPRLYV